MKHERRGGEEGSTLIITLATLTALATMAAIVLLQAGPRVRMAYQNAAWQEARLAAESGIDAAMGELLQHATNGTSASPWSGWKDAASGTPANSTPGVSTSQGLLPSLTTPVINLLTGLLGGPKPAGTGAVASSPPIFLDNFRVSAATGVPTEVDIQLWALQPTAASHIQWFRIRSMATCAMPMTAYEAPANLDAPLRRFSLRKVRASLRQDDVGSPTTVPLPNVSRAVEVLVAPVLPFELALWTNGATSLSYTGGWSVDSYDSTDPLKSGVGGVYPGRGSPLAQRNGDIGNSQGRSADSLYGALVAANGTTVRGAVATNGGDDPQTGDHENVSGAVGVDATRIRDDFNREMNRVPRPGGITPQAAPANGTYVPGTPNAPSVYEVGGLTSLRIATPLLGAKGVLVVMVDGDLNLSGPLIVPSSVICVLFVSGNITFRDNVNSGPWNSNLPSHLVIIGDVRTPHQTLQTYGAIKVCAAFYGPSFEIALDGQSDWCGAISGSTFQVRGSGDGGLHYDESLSLLGPPVSYRIARYVEDVRE